MRKKKKKYFHLISNKKYKRLFKKNVSIKFIMRRFKQPSWCTFPEALSGPMGCWSLMRYGNDENEIKKGCYNCQVSKNYKEIKK